MELAPGRYWFDLFGRDEPAFATWRKAHRADVAVRVTSGSDPAFIIFEVKSPVQWELGGRPTPAGPEIRGPSDVVQRPDPAEPSDYLPDVPSVGAGAVVGALAVLGVLWFLKR